MVERIDWKEFEDRDGRGMWERVTNEREKAKGWGRQDPLALGLDMTCHVQEQMSLLLREALSVGKIAFDTRFFSIEMQPVEAKKRLVEELHNFSVVTEPAKTTFGKARLTYP